MFPLNETVSYVSSISIQWQGMRCGSGHPPTPPMALSPRSFCGRGWDVEHGHPPIAHSFIWKTCSLQFHVSPHFRIDCPASIYQAFHEHISKIKEYTYLKTLMGVSAYKKNPFQMEAKTRFSLLSVSTVFRRNMHTAVSLPLLSSAPCRCLQTTKDSQR